MDDETLESYFLQTEQGGEGNDIDYFSSKDRIYLRRDICFVSQQILAIAIPAILSAVSGQVTYIINIVMAGMYAETKQIAGLGLGHATSQCMGIMLFLGLNSRLTT